MQKQEYKLFKVGDIPDTEQGADWFIKYMGSVVRANWDKAMEGENNFLGIAQSWGIDAFARWVKSVFIYKADPRWNKKQWTTVEAEAIKYPQTMINDYKKYGKLIGDCKDAAVFTATILMNYQHTGVIPANQVFLLQIINYGTNEKHVAAAYRTDINSGMVTIIDPTTNADIDPKRIPQILIIQTGELIKREL